MFQRRMNWLQVLPTWEDADQGQEQTVWDTNKVKNGLLWWDPEFALSLDVV